MAKIHSPKTHFSGDVSALTAFILLTFLIFILYSNTFHAAWQFDDKPNIVENQRLHIEDLSASTLWMTFFAGSGKNTFYRPLASLSLALNWYAGPGNTFGFHIVNTIIHILTAFILYLACRELLQTPSLKERNRPRDTHFIALLAAVLWAVNPIQTQAVTYIVQRMASMAALFYVASIYCYVKGRRTGKEGVNGQVRKKRTSRILLYAASFLCFGAAMMAKENAVMLPLSLLLVDVIFFQSFSTSTLKKKHIIVLAGSGLAGVMLVTALYQFDFLDFAVRGYASRPFTMGERLLTQPRILLYYLSQIFYPLPSRLSITHDVVVSTSLFKPWTTLPAILVILAVVGAAMRQMRKWPLMSFALLFFLLNHAVESSVLPLELMFEHRNYLPSLFLFLPIAVTFKGLCDRYQIRSRLMRPILVVFMVLVIVGLGSFTYLRNQAWKTETTLWQDAMLKAPDDARPLVNLAIQLAWAGKPTPMELDVAMAMFKKAMHLNMARTFLATDIINNIGIIYYKKGEYQKAVDTYKRGLELDPGFLKLRYDLISSRIMLGQWAAASKEADALLENPKGYLESDYFNLKGFILLWQNQPQAALGYFQTAMAMEPGNTAALLNMGIALSLTGEFAKADRSLQQAAALTMGDIRPYYALVENSARAGDHVKAESYARRMLDRFPVQTAINGIEWYADTHKTAPMSADIILPVLAETLAGSARELEKYSFANPGK